MKTYRRKRRKKQKLQHGCYPSVLTYFSEIKKIQKFEKNRMCSPAPPALMGQRECYGDCVLVKIDNRILIRWGYNVGLLLNFEFWRKNYT